ncbi:MAG: MATE family efflux transporter [Isosphaeraceae bacterium]
MTLDRGRQGGEFAGGLRPTLSLAVPVVLTELGWMAMGVVDTMIVGRLGAEAIGAVAIGAVVFFTVAVLGLGLLLGLDTLVSRAFGAGDLDDCHRWLFQGVYLALAVTPPLTLVVLASPIALAASGFNPTVLRDATPYIHATAWSLFPLLIFTAFRRYLQAMGVVRPVMFALLSANVVNAVGNWMLVFGRFGAPVLGVEGSGWATTISRTFMLLVVVIYTVWRDRRYATGLWRTPWGPDRARLGRLIGLGLPAALHMTLEVGVFATATALAARLDAASLAAHQVVLNVSSMTFMIPFGLASAGAVLVGQALGRGDPPGAAHAGWTTLGITVVFMTGAGLVFCLFPRVILRAFTDDSRVVSAGLSLMFVAAGFQLFDGVQGVTTGNLRGAGDTRTPMLWSLLAHWGLGLPVGYTLAFPAGLGALGLWLGLCLGLVVLAIALLIVWVRKTRREWKPLSASENFEPRRAPVFDPGSSFQS